LPGIAAIVLTLGMAVDERADRSACAKSAQRALGDHRDGVRLPRGARHYRRSHVTTLISTLPPFLLGLADQLAVALLIGANLFYPLMVTQLMTRSGCGTRPKVLPF
jgi:hypothetical protein